MAGKNFRVFGLGQCSLDYLARIDGDFPQPDLKREFSEMVIQGGGPVATALVALARWGISCTFSGVAGNDAFGDTIKKSLDTEGVDTTGLIIREGAESQFAFVIAEPEKGRRTILWRRPTGPPISAEEINFELLRGSEILLTDGLFKGASIAACRAAKKAGVQVIVDAGTLRDGMIEIAEYSDCFIASEAFAGAFLGANRPVEACLKLAELGPFLVGVTLGARGYVAVCDGKIIQKPAYGVEAIDTTGCGDVFHAGFVYGRLNGWEIDKCLDFAAWSAARVSLKIGGRSGIPSLKQIRENGYI